MKGVGGNDESIFCQMKYMLSMSIFQIIKYPVADLYTFGLWMMGTLRFGFDSFPGSDIIILQFHNPYSGIWVFLDFSISTIKLLIYILIDSV